MYSQNYLSLCGNVCSVGMATRLRVGRPRSRVSIRDRSKSSIFFSITSRQAVGPIQNVPGGKANILGGHSVNLSKKYFCTCVLFRTVSEIQLFHCREHCTLYRRATRHVLTRVAKCIDVDGGIFWNVLYYVNCNNFVTRTINTELTRDTHN
jgi:hypothetical protein